MKSLIKMPQISVVLSAYNAAQTIRQAIDSILAQTYEDYEFLIVNDASTDDTEKIILSYFDSRIIYVNNLVNEGLINSLNKAIRCARGKYIVRMDADDISFPNRLYEQYFFMEKHPEIDVCGTWMYQFNDSGYERKVIAPVFDKDIKAFLFFKNPIFHPTVMMRKDIFNVVNGYKKEDYRQEDLGLWVELTKCGKKFYNLPIPLLYYRYSPDSESNLGKNNLKCYKEVRRRIIDRMLSLTSLDIDESSKEIISVLSSSILVKECSVKYIKQNVKKLFILLDVKAAEFDRVSLRRALAYHLVLLLFSQPALIKYAFLFFYRGIVVDMILAMSQYIVMRYVSGKFSITTHAKNDK